MIRNLINHPVMRAAFAALGITAFSAGAANAEGLEGFGWYRLDSEQVACSQGDEEVQSCRYYFLPKDILFDSSWNAMLRQDITSYQVDDTWDSLRRYRYSLGSGLSVGMQPYMKSFGKRGQTLGFGAQFGKSAISLTVKDPSLHWMTDLGETDFNVRLGTDEEDSGNTELFIGIGRHW